jgi:hypothetical protein
LTNIIWGCANTNVINDLFLKQKKAVRIITKKPYNSHTQPLFCKAEILPLPSLIKFFQLQFMHMYSHNLLPQSFGPAWARNIDRDQNEDRPILRNSQELTVPFARTAFAQKMPLSLFPKMWNEFEDIFKHDPSKNIFSKKLKEHMFKLLSEGFTCVRPNCPVCL